MFVCCPSVSSISPCAASARVAGKLLVVPRSPWSYKQPSAREPGQPGFKCPEPPPSGWVTLRQLPCCPWGSLPSMLSPRCPQTLTHLAAPPLLASFSSCPSSPLPNSPTGFPRIALKPATTQKNYLCKKLLFPACLWGPPNQGEQYTRSS